MRNPFACLAFAFLASCAGQPAFAETPRTWTGFVCSDLGELKDALAASIVAEAGGASADVFFPAAAAFFDSCKSVTDWPVTVTGAVASEAPATRPSGAKSHIVEFAAEGRTWFSWVSGKNVGAFDKTTGSI